MTGSERGGSARNFWSPDIVPQPGFNIASLIDGWHPFIQENRSHLRVLSVFAVQENRLTCLSTLFLVNLTNGDTGVAEYQR